MPDSHNNESNNAPSGGQTGGGGGRSNRRRRRPNRSGQSANREPGQELTANSEAPRREQQQPGARSSQGPGPRHQQGPRPGSGPRHPDSRNRDSQSGNRPRRGSGRVLTINQILVKYDNLLEQHLITRRKYFEYFNRSDERQLYRLEKNFFDSIEHLRRFEAGLEPWQREALESRKTERYRPDLTYSTNHDLDPSSVKVELPPEEMPDPHFKDSQKEAFAEFKEDTEESMGTYEDYLKLKGLA